MSKEENKILVDKIFILMNLIGFIKVSFKYNPINGGKILIYEFRKDIVNKDRINYLIHIHQDKDGECTNINILKEGEYQSFIIETSLNYLETKFCYVLRKKKIIKLLNNV